MPTVEHKDIAAGERHAPHQWAYADATARLAATGFVAGDVYKVALQQSDNTLWLLTDDSPITWAQVGDGVGYAPGGTDVAVADGGTGASTAGAARTNLGLGTAATHDHGDYEPDLGNPGTDGYVLSSTAAGVRSWTAPGSGGGGGDPASATHAATSKATPVDADEVPLVDSAASNALKKLTWANLKATAKAYFDTLYAAITHTHAASDLASGTLATARLGSGTASSTTFLRGDQTWSPVSAGSSTPTPASVTLVEEFPNGQTTSGQIGTHGWTLFQGSVTTQPAVAGHPGIVRVSSGTTAGTTAKLALGGGALLVLPSDSFELIWIVNPTQIDSNTLLRVGLAGSNTADTPLDALYFERLGTDTNWFAVARGTSVQTRTDTGVAAATGSIKFRIRPVSAGTIGYTVNANTEQTIATNLPTVALVPLIHIGNVAAAAAKTLDLDYCQLTISGLTR